jgi:ABC-type multidrug transport system fused ATPase/permease subunit
VGHVESRFYNPLSYCNFTINIIIVIIVVIIILIIIIIIIIIIITIIRKETALRTFDEMIVSHLDKNLKHAGINLVSGAVMKEIVKEADGTMTVHLEVFTCVHV